MLVSRLGTKRPGVDTSPKAICRQCGLKRFKRDFRLKSGRVVPICRDCRKNPPESKRSAFERHLPAINRRLKADFIERKTKRKEVKNMAKTINKAQEFASLLTTLPDKIAAIVSRTYACRGDSYTMADDEALARIRDLLEEIDVRIIERNKKKRLS